jgi:hypothetical protein
MTDPLTNLFSTGPNRSIRAHEPQIHWPTVRLTLAIITALAILGWLFVNGGSNCWLFVNGGSN